jgi:hypothetical protein
VRSTPLTNELGLAGLTGQVFGFTVPSSSRMEDVIGDQTKDFALNAYFEDRQEGFWFSEDLLEFVDHGPGGEMIITGAPTKWVRSPSGEWTEHKVTEQESTWPQKIWQRVLKQRE